MTRSELRDPEVGNAAKVVRAVVGERVDVGAPLPSVQYLFACSDLPDLWEVRRMHLDEGLSTLYGLRLELQCSTTDADVDALLGADIELTIDRESVMRRVCGIVTRLEHLGIVEDRLRVRVEVAPALALLAQRVDSRLWQHASIPAIVDEILTSALAGYGREVDLSHLRGSYPVREYVVQYHESDLDFACRLLEAAGIGFWFDHEREGGREVLVLEDSADHWAEIPMLESAESLPIIASREDLADVESLQRFEQTRALASTSVVRRSFDWRTPTEPEQTRAPAGTTPASDARGRVRELYHHESARDDEDDARVAMELGIQAQTDRTVRATSNAVGLAPGRRLIVDGNRRGLPAEFLCIRVVHHGDCPEVGLGEASKAPTYENEFECLRFDGQRWYPPPTTPRPRIRGPQTALVVGPDGEEIHTDGHGRIKVRFHWDRQHTLTDDSSMWIRVARGWAGAGFGVLFVPRIGMEVVVEFLDGDPDRPLLTGCVYDGDNRCSVTLPDQKTRSSIRTRSSPGGAGFNELRFEDASGGEEIFLHAQRDLNEIVGRNHTAKVSGNQTLLVAADRRETISGNQNLTIQKTRTELIRGDERITNESLRTTKIHGEDSLEVFAPTMRRHHEGVTTKITGTDTLHVTPSKGGRALAKTRVEGDVRANIDDQLAVDVGKLVALTQSDAGKLAKIKLEQGSMVQCCSDEWRANAAERMELHSAKDLFARGGAKVEVTQGNAAIRIENDVVMIDASEIRLTVGENLLVLNASGFSLQTNAVVVAASDIVTISGASVDID